MLHKLEIPNTEKPENTKLAQVNLSDCVLDSRAIIGRCTIAARDAGVSKADTLSFFMDACTQNFTGLLDLVARKFDVVLDEE